MRRFIIIHALLLALAAAAGPATAATTPPDLPPAAQPPRAVWADCGSCWQRTEWEREIAGYHLVMLSALRDSPARVAAQEQRGEKPLILRQRFELRRGGQVMLDIEDRWLDPARRPDLRLPPPGTDVAGSGKPQLVLLGWSGAGDCCFTLHVIELGASPRVLARVVTQDGIPRLIQRDADPDFEIIVEDPTYAGWDLLPDTALPRVVLKYDPQAGRYRFAAAQMRRPPPPVGRLEAEARLLHEAAADDAAANGADDDTVEHVPGRLVRTMLQLIYAGNYPMARRFLDEAWSDGYGVTREAFLRDLMECRLPRSPYWIDIATLNGLTPQAPRADCAAATAAGQPGSQR